MDADNAVAQATAAPPAERRALSPIEFSSFYRGAYRDLITQAMYAGANKTEAEEAANVTMAEALKCWARIEDPQAWARKAVVTNFVKAKKRDQERIRRQKRDYLVTRALRGDEVFDLLIEQQYIDELLAHLTAPQREVMELVVEGHRPVDIADMIGISFDAVRQRVLGAGKRLRPLLDKDQAPRPGAGATRKEAR